MQPLVALVALLAFATVVAAKSKCKEGKSTKDMIEAGDDVWDRCEGERCWRSSFSGMPILEGTDTSIDRVHMGCKTKAWCDEFGAEGTCVTEQVAKADDKDDVGKDWYKQEVCCCEGDMCLEPEDAATKKPDDDGDNAATAKTLPPVAALLVLAAAVAFATLG